MWRKSQKIFWTLSKSPVLLHFMIAASLELSAQPAASSTVPRDLLPIVHLVTLPSQQLFSASTALRRGQSRLLFQLSQTCEVYFSVSGASLLPPGKYASVGRKPQHERASLGPCAHGNKGRKSVQINLIELSHLSWGARTSYPYIFLLLNRKQMSVTQGGGVFPVEAANDTEDLRCWIKNL